MRATGTPWGYCADMYRVRIGWTGSAMGEGVSTMHFTGSIPNNATEAKNASDNMFGLFSALVLSLPSAVTLTPDSVVDSVDDATGEIEDQLGITPATGFAGGAGGAYANGVGARYRWRTAGFRNGRRVVGTTFITPLLATVYESNGTLTSAVISTMNGAITSFLAANATDSITAVVWSRPSAPGLSDGVAHAITSGTVPDQVSWLTSRRS